MRYFVFLVCVLFLSSLVGATTISIDDNFNSKYSVGDVVDVSFSVESDQAFGDFLYTYLDCGADKEIADKRYVFIDEELKNFTFEVPLFKSGDCRFEIKFDSETSRSEEFVVGNDLAIVYSLNDRFFFPGEEIKISGNITKFNGNNFDGKVFFKVGDLVEKTLEIDDGRFSFSYSFGENALPQNYSLVVSSEEKDYFGEVLNSGSVTENVLVKSVPTYFEIDSPESIKPPINYTFGVALLDQAKKIYPNESVLVEVVDYSGDSVFKKEIKSPGNFSIYFPSDFERGSAFINVYYGDLYKRQPLYIEDSKKIEVYMLEGNLVFVNEGNIFYKGGYNFVIENGSFSEKVFVNLSLGVGEEMKYPLDYVGVYNISSSDENFTNQVLEKPSSITGYSIINDSPITFWTVVVTVLILLLIGFYLFKKNKLSGLDLKAFFSKFKKSKSSVFDSENSAKVIAPKEFSTIKSVVKSDGKKRIFLLHFISKKGIEEYKEVISGSDFSLRKINEHEGYVMVFENGGDLYNGFYNLSEKIVAKSKGIGDGISVVLNSGRFEKSVEIVKKFVVFNKEISEKVNADLIIPQNFMKHLEVKGKFMQKSIEVKGFYFSVFVR